MKAFPLLGGADRGDAYGANLKGVEKLNAAMLDEACAAFQRAATQSPDESVYSYNLGIANLQCGRAQHAFEAFLRSLRGNALLPEAHFWAWAAIQRLGLMREVNTRLRRALHTDPAQQAFEPCGDRVPLDSVTVCAIDCAVPDLGARALRKSMAQCRFAAAKLLTSHAVRYDDIETVAIPHIGSIEEYCRFVMKSLAGYIDTQFVLVVQWDGYVLRGEGWTNDFLTYDYIGARWDGDRPENAGKSSDECVGNGGFSLRSDMFLRAGTDPAIELTHPEDEHLCKTYRSLLEEGYGIRYAPASIADQFAFEILQPSQAPFGFHGCFNVARFEADPKWMRFDFLEKGFAGIS